MYDYYPLWEKELDSLLFYSFTDGFKIGYNGVIESSIRTLFRRIIREYDDNYVSGNEPKESTSDEKDKDTKEKCPFEISPILKKREKAYKNGYCATYRECFEKNFSENLIDGIKKGKEQKATEDAIELHKNGVSDELITESLKIKSYQLLVTLYDDDSKSIDLNKSKS